jgi:hypothetical protein
LTSKSWCERQPACTVTRHDAYSWHDSCSWIVDATGPTSSNFGCSSFAAVLISSICVSSSLARFSIRSEPLRLAVVVCTTRARYFSDACSMTSLCVSAPFNYPCKREDMSCYKIPFVRHRTEHRPCANMQPHCLLAAPVGLGPCLPPETVLLITNQTPLCLTSVRKYISPQRHCHLTTHSMRTSCLRTVKNAASWTVYGSRYCWYSKLGTEQSYSVA